MAAPVRVGVVGAGPWAEVVASSVRRHPDTELAGVWARRSDRAAGLADRHATAVHASLESLARASTAVAFAVAPDAQLDLAARVVLAGRDVLLEKPVSRSVSETRQFAGLVAARGTALRVHYPRLLALGMVERAGIDRIEVDVLTAAGTVGPYSASAWRQEDDGALWDLGPHALSLATMLLGPVRRIAAERDADRVVLRAEHSGAATSLLRVGLREVVPSESLRAWRGTHEVAIESESLTGEESFGRLLDDYLHPVAGDRGTALRSFAFSAHLVEALDGAGRSLCDGVAVDLGVPAVTS